MKRKIVKHGPSTFIVSLPSKWVKKYGIDKGDEVEVAERGKTIVVSPEVTRESLGMSSDVSGLIPRLVDRLLARSYQKGYDRIELVHNDPVILETIRTKVPELIGYEIMEQSDKTCIIQSISSRIEIDFDQSLRRAFLLVKQMVESCQEAYKKCDKNALKNLHLKDLEVNRLCYFCLRQINKEHYIEPEKAQQIHILYYIIEILEDLGDACKKLANHLADCCNKNKDFINLLGLIIEQFDISYTYFYKATKDKANDAFNLFKKIDSEIERIAGKCSLLERDEVIGLMYFKEMAHIIYHFTTMRLDFLAEDSIKRV